MQVFPLDLVLESFDFPLELVNCAGLRMIRLLSSFFFPVLFLQNIVSFTYRDHT